MMRARVWLSAVLAGLVVGVLGASSADAAVSRDFSSFPRLSSSADSFDAAPSLNLPSITDQLKSIEEKTTTAAECVALCDLAAEIDRNPLGPGASREIWPSQYAKARYYDPFTARFTQADSFLGTIDDPPSLHRFAYANANPTYFTDPTGNYSWNEFKGDAQWGARFAGAAAADLLQNGGQRVDKIGAAVVANALHTAAETTLAIHDAGALTAELATGGRYEATLMSSGGNLAQERLANGESAFSVTADIGVNVVANVATAGTYGTVQQQYRALRDHAQGKATIEDVENRLADAAGGAILNTVMTSALIKRTTGSAWGPDIPGLSKVSGPRVVVENVSQLATEARVTIGRALGESPGAGLRARYGSRFDEYMRVRGQDYTPAAAARLSEPYGGIGHHYIQQSVWKAPINSVGRSSPVGRALTWLRDSPLNVKSSRGMSTARFYELHSRLHGGATFGKRSAQGNRLLPGESWLASKAPAPSFSRAEYLWYGSPDVTRALLAGVGAALPPNPYEE